MPAIPDSEPIVKTRRARAVTYLFGSIAILLTLVGIYMGVQVATNVQAANAYNRAPECAAAAPLVSAASLCHTETATLVGLKGSESLGGGESYWIKLQFRDATTRSVQLPGSLPPSWRDLDPPLSVSVQRQGETIVAVAAPERIVRTMDNPTFRAERSVVGFVAATIAALFFGGLTLLNRRYARKTLPDPKRVSGNCS